MYTQPVHPRIALITMTIFLLDVVGLQEVYPDFSPLCSLIYGGRRGLPELYITGSTAEQLTLGSHRSMYGWGASFR